MTFLNIHTHQAPGTNEWCIQNYFMDFDSIPATGFYSAGLHPWHLSEESKTKDFEQLEQASALSNVVAIGECGLDKICNTPFQLQTDVFTAQIQLANNINKPLIIHCVKAFEETFALLKKEKNKVPVIFHGFNKNVQLAQQIIHNGFYLSLGKALETERMQKVLQAIPIERFFLETDDTSIPIKEVYAYACKALQITEDSLSLQLQKNVTSVFGTEPNDQ